MNKHDLSLPELAEGAQYCEVAAEYSGQRIDNFLIARLKGLPRSRLYRILRKGEVRVNSKRVRPTYRLQAGDRLRVPPVRLAETGTALPPSEASVNTLSKRILYEDDSVMAINKPAAMPVHGGTHLHYGVIETLRVLRPALPQLQLVHRLDRGTSGCLLLAKDLGSLRELHALWQAQAVEKRYITLVQGEWPAACTTIETHLVKNQEHAGERVVEVSTNEGKLARTRFAVLERYAKATLLEVTPETGRMHQIRVHCTHAGHPIAGDEKYGDAGFNQWIKQTGLRRLFLHAAMIRCTLPSGQLIEVKAPLEPALQACLQHLEIAPG